MVQEWHDLLDQGGVHLYSRLKKLFQTWCSWAIAGSSVGTKSRSPSMILRRFKMRNSRRERRKMNC
jgi:hypothetical protein